MFGGPEAQASEEQKKLQEQYANSTIKTAGVLAAALWVTPIVFHFIKRQL